MNALLTDLSRKKNLLFMGEKERFYVKLNSMTKFTKTRKMKEKVGNKLTVPSANAEITFPRADNDLLMFLASSRTEPSAPVLLT